MSPQHGQLLNCHHQARSGKGFGGKPLMVDLDDKSLQAPQKVHQCHHQDSQCRRLQAQSCHWQRVQQSTILICSKSGRIQLHIAKIMVQFLRQVHVNYLNVREFNHNSPTICRRVSEFTQTAIFKIHSINVRSSQLRICKVYSLQGRVRSRMSA